MTKQGDRGWNDLVTRSVDLGAGMLRLYGESVRDVAAGKVSYTTVGERLAAIARHEGSAYARSLAHAYLDYWGSVLDIGADFRQRLATGDAPAARAKSSPTNGGCPGGAELEFTGRRGEDIARAFVVENNQPQAVDVSFEVSEFAAEGGDARLRPGLSISPAEFHLESGEEQVVTCRLTLDPSFAPGQPYFAFLRVIGFPGMEVALRAAVYA
jgi:hypothetical protein